MLNYTGYLKLMVMYVGKLALTRNLFPKLRVPNLKIAQFRYLFFSAQVRHLEAVS